MPAGGYHRFSSKEDRMAGHVAASMRARGMSPGRARSVGYATVVKHGFGRFGTRRTKDPGERRVQPRTRGSVAGRERRFRTGSRR